MYLDEKGLIVQSDGDAGDCLQREGFWYEGCWLNIFHVAIPGMASYPTALQELRTPDGFVRSWQARGGPPPWNTPGDTSRDQLVSNIRACGYYGLNGNLTDLLKAVVKNFSRFPNNDIAFINDYSRFARALRWWWAYPMILIGDFIMVINTLIRCWKGRNFDDVGDDVNHVGDLAQAQACYPTPFGWLARKFYVWWRPRGPTYAIDWYFRPEAKGNPEFAVLWIPIIKKF